MARDRNTIALPVVRLHGLRPMTIGSYLAAIGLLRVMTRDWPSIRGAWRDGAFCLIGGPDGRDELCRYLGDVAANDKWTSYDRNWTEAVNKEKSRRPGMPSPLWQHQSNVPESDALLCAAHVVATERRPDAKQPSAWRFYNPLLGLGGKVGQRDFAKGWSEARDAVRNALRPETDGTKAKAKRTRKRSKNAWTADEIHADLEAFLTGASCYCLGAWNAASWFSGANKAYNSGQSWYAEGQITPWAMLLACEGLPLLAGSPSRRLGARTRALAAFPFVSRPAAPRTQGEAGRDRAEVWLPLWSRPMTLAEVRQLFLRGRAEIGGAGATTPAAFAAAILRRGVDAGIDGFQRFVLGRTTTDQVFESRLDRFVARPRRIAGTPEEARLDVIRTVLNLYERLPRDVKRGQRWQFRGLRGPLEAAVVAFAAEPEAPDRATAMLDAAVAALERVDRNREHRKAGVQWRLLPPAWIPMLFGNVAPTAEARIAMAIASVGRADSALIVHRFGVSFDKRYRCFTFPERVPHTRTWSNRPLAKNLAAIVRRRLTDAGPTDPLPFAAFIGVGMADVAAWLETHVDPISLELWLSRFALFDWSQVPEGVRALAFSPAQSAVRGPLALFALIRSLMEPGEIKLATGDGLLPQETGARTVPAARQIASLLGAGHVNGAVRVARTRYHVARQPPAQTLLDWTVADAERLLASLLIPVNRTQLGREAARWLRPTHRQGVV